MDEVFDHVAALRARLSAGGWVPTQADRRLAGLVRAGARDTNALRLALSAAPGGGRWHALVEQAALMMSRPVAPLWMVPSISRPAVRLRNLLGELAGAITGRAGKRPGPLRLVAGSCLLMPQLDCLDYGPSPDREATVPPSPSDDLGVVYQVSTIVVGIERTSIEMEEDFPSAPSFRLFHHCYSCRSESDWLLWAYGHEFGAGLTHRCGARQQARFLTRPVVESRPGLRLGGIWPSLATIEDHLGFTGAQQEKFGDCFPP